jgi:hypothetical protein
VALKPLYGRERQPKTRHDRVMPPDERSLRLLIRALDTRDVELTPELIRALGLVVAHWPPAVEQPPAA